MDKAELIRTMREGYEHMADALGRIPDERLLAPAMGDWTGKDVIAHMAWWHDHSARVIEGLRAGREPYDQADPANTVDALNARVYREHVGDSPEQARQEFQESFARLLSALEPLTEEDLFAPDRWPWLGGRPLVETLLWDSARHYEDHRPHLTP